MLVEDRIAEMEDLLKDRVTALKADRDTTWVADQRVRGANRSPIVIDQGPARSVRQRHA